MKVSTLYNKTNYLINTRFIKSRNIIEYDISRANISILYEAGVLSVDEFNHLCNIPKLDREIYIGKLIGNDPSGNIYNIIKEGITNGKKKLFYSNNIQDVEIIRIANDAVYIMRAHPLTKTKFGLIEFKPKNQYNIFARLGSLSIFFGNIMGDINIDVIGLGKDKIILHSNYMLNFIGNLFYLMETSTIDQIMDYYLGFYNDYIHCKLDINYYRELNEDSLFIIKSKRNKKFGMMCANNINDVDITYNAGILRELYGIIIGFNKR